MRKMMLGLAAVGCLVILPNVTSLNAQGDNPQPTCKMCPGTYIPIDELQAYLKKAIAERRTDQQVRDVDIGKANVASPASRSHLEIPIGGAPVRAFDASGKELPTQK
jgi:hypothetical protein